MSGERFDPERFRELMELEETVEVLTAEVTLFPQKEEEPTEEPSASEERETAPEEIPCEGSDRSAVEPAEEPAEEVRREPLPLREETAATAEEKKPAESLDFAQWAEEETPAGNSFREWDRRWERESRRYDGGFSLY